MRNNRKIKALRSKIGPVAYAIYCMLLEYLTGADNNRLKINEMEIELISADFGVTITQLKDTLNMCIKLELLQMQEGVLLCNSLDERLAPVYQNRQNQSLKAFKRFEKESCHGIVSLKETKRNDATAGVIAQESTQSKVNKRTIKIENTLSTESSIVRPIGEKFEKNGKINHNSGNGIFLGETEGEIDPPLPF